MAVPTKKDDYSDQAVSRFIEANKDKPNMEAFFRSKASGRFDILQASEGEAQQFLININNRQYLYDTTSFESASQTSTALVDILNQEVFLTDNFDSYTSFPGTGPFGTWIDAGGGGNYLGPQNISILESRSGSQSLITDLSSFNLSNAGLEQLRAIAVPNPDTPTLAEQKVNFWFKIPTTYPGAIDTAVSALHPAVLIANSGINVFVFIGIYMYYSGGWKFDLSYISPPSPTINTIASGFTFSEIATDNWINLEVTFNIDGSSVTVDVGSGSFTGTLGSFVDFGGSVDFVGINCSVAGPSAAYTLPNTFIDDFGVGDSVQIVDAQKLDTDDDYLYIKANPRGTALEVEVSSNLAFKNIGLIDQLQEIEDTLFQLLLNRSIDTATGLQLEKIGLIVGLNRAGSQSDDAYRDLLLVQIQTNLSKGEINRFIGILKSFTNSTTVKVTELFPAHVQAIFDGVAPDDIQNKMDAVLAGGVGLTLINSETIDYFGFEGDPDALGFSSVLDITSGGKIAGKVTT